MQDFLAVNKLKFKELLKSNFPVTNYLFVISKEVIARKQILQVINTCCYAWPILLFYLQPVRSVSYPKGINVLISQ